MAWSNGTFTRTNGVNTGATTWATDAAAGVKIRSDRHDTHDQDLATGINQCINKDGSNTASQLNVDNIRVDGNTISSQNSNGNIELSPNGTGLVNVAAVGDLAIAGTAVTSSADELNILDGVTASAAEINIMDGVTATTAEINTNVGNTSGTYTGTATGLTTSPTTTVYYRVVGNIVHIEIRAGLTGTSNAAGFTITGAPAGIRPASTSGFSSCGVVNNGSDEAGLLQMTAGGVIDIRRASSTSFTGSGTKTIGAVSFSYMLNLPS